MAPVGPSGASSSPLEDVAMATDDSNLRLSSRPSDEPQSQSGLEAEEVEQILQYPYHGTCSYCKHFHKNLTLSLPTDGQTHTRIKCERCGHSMCGLGRTDTQFSLASVQSFPIEAGGAGSLQPEPRQTCTDRLHEPATTENETYEDARTDQARDNNPIFEGGQDSGRGVLRISSEIVANNSSTMARWKAFAARGLATLHIPFPGLMNRLQPFFGLVHTLTGGLLQRQRRGSTTTEVSFFGWRLCFQLHPPARHRINGEQATRSTAGNLSDLRAANTVAETNTVGQRSFTIDVAALPFHRVERLEDSVTNDQEERTSRNQRLFQIRREKTLRRNALQQLGCKCSSRCICQRDPIGRNTTRSRRSFSSSHGPTPRRLSSSAVPNYALEPTFLNLIGIHFDQEDSNSISGSSYMNETSSQVPTLEGDSERSSASLSSDPLSSPRRSSSSPTRFPTHFRRAEILRLRRQGSSSTRSSSLATDARAQTALVAGAQRFFSEPESSEAGTQNDAQRTTPVQAGMSTVHDQPNHITGVEPDGQMQTDDPALLLDAPESQSNPTTPTLRNPEGDPRGPSLPPEPGHQGSATVTGAIERLSLPEPRMATRSQSFG